MNKRIHGLRAAVLALLAAPALCAAQMAAQDVNFPDPSRGHPRMGKTITPDAPSRVRPGLGKDQVRLLLGNPHFREGLWGVAEWDYVLDLRDGRAGGALGACQLKVKFEQVDGTYRVASTHWKNPECAASAASAGSSALATTAR